MDSDPITQSTLETITRFNEAVNAHDLDLVMALLTDDSVFENTYPSPDGERYEGRAAVSGFWLEFFESSPKSNFEFEETFASGERAFVRWEYHWQNADETSGHVRGVDIFRVRDGKVAEKFSYVKG
jgi:predicted SnoaL-like aldol condensation-catalyzing enzyme